MRLASAAKAFDKQALTDAYGSAYIMGQLDPFDDSRRDGVITRRRILSVAPDVNLPARGVLKLDGYVWIAGGDNPDYFGGEAIRRKFVLHESDGLANLRTFAQILAGTTGLSAYVALEWVKATKEISESSDLVDVLSAMFAKSESIPDVGVLTLDGIRYLLREPHQTAAGFQSANAEQIREPAVESGTFTGRTYDPVADTWSGSGTAVNFLRLRWQSHFRYISGRALHYQPGDGVLVCLKSAATPKANDKIVLADGTWQVLTVQSEDTLCWSLHVRLIPA